MNSRPYALLALLPALLIVSAVKSSDAEEVASKQGVAADNSKMNKPGLTGSAPTADQAMNTRTDRELMRDIRKEIVKDKSLSVYAHNVKLIAQNGQVTLKGVVRTEQERSSIESKAAGIAGQNNVINELTVQRS